MYIFRLFAEGYYFILVAMTPKFEEFQGVRAVGYNVINSSVIPLHLAHTVLVYFHSILRVLLLKYEYI
jgi:hypothetical protein